MIKTIETLLDGNQFIIKQNKEWLEILSGFETKNKYMIMNPQKEVIGHIIEEGSGFLKIIQRFFLKSHRPFTFSIFDTEGNRLLTAHRKFFWFFSDLFIETENKKFGSIHRRFAFFQKKYSLIDKHAHELFTVKSPIWRLWTFPIYDHLGNKMGVITKKWQGFLSEIFTDADAFLIDLTSQSLTPEQKVLLFASGISIDFDFFDNNQGSSGLLDFLGN